MASTDNYTGLITSQYRDKPKYMAMIEATAQPLVDTMNLLASMPGKFDLDLAVGDQQDAVGEWVGISREVATPLAGVYFAFDTDGVGFDQGVWKGPYDPDSGVTSLDDETYRLLMRAKIGANRWDGTLSGSAAILAAIFTGDTHVFIEDNQDMTMTIGVSGQIPSALFLALLSGGYIPIKPATVGVDVTVVTSVDGAPIFGFDMDNEFVAGFDVGAWATPLQG